MGILLFIVIVSICYFIYGEYKKQKDREILEQKKREEEEKKRKKYKNDLKRAKIKVSAMKKEIDDAIAFKFLNYSKYIELYDRARVLYDSVKDFYGDLVGSNRLFFDFVLDNEFRDKHNKQFIDYEKSECRDYFVSIDKDHHGLTEKQLEAVFTDEDATLINAGAGTGKTKTLENKIVYLHVLKHIPLEDILVITYSKKSQEDMMKKIVEILKSAGVDVNEEKLGKTISTFHAFGYGITNEYFSKHSSFTEKEKLIGKGLVGKPLIEEHELKDAIKYVMDKIKKKPDYQKLISKFLLYHIAPDYDINDFQNLDDYYKTVKKSYITAIINKKTGKNVYVKSNGEVTIANFLVSNGVDVEYEPNGHYYTNEDGKKKLYKPDFYLPKYGVYIEYFGVDKHGKTAPYINNKNYVKRMNQKINQHRLSGNKFIDIRFADYQEGKDYFLEKLTFELKKYGVIFYHRSVESIFDIFEGPLSGLEKMLSTFLALYKESNLSLSNLRKKAKNFDKYNVERNQLFLDLFEVYYREYTDYLEQSGQIDFGDMISEANKIIKQGSVVRKYKYILVDEFQDISEARANLIQNLIENPNETRLFCVGDDWQSIYRFAGSNTNIFLNFQDYFGFTKKITLDKTFRFNQGISNVSGEFVMVNEEQTIKTLHSNSLDTFHKMYIVERGDDSGNFEAMIGRIAEDYYRKRIKLPISKRQSVNYDKDGEKGNIISILFITRYSLYKYHGTSGQNFFDYLTLKFKFEKKIGKNSGNGKLGKEEVYYITKENDLTYRDMELRFKCKDLTIHKAKGLEADYVVLDYVNQNLRYNFPSNFEDDPILDLILENLKGKVLYPEERRLFYVGITRGKNLAFMVYDKGYQSLFLEELLRLGTDSGTVSVLNDGETSINDSFGTKLGKCKNCGGSLRLSKYSKNFNVFYCSNLDMGCTTEYVEYNGVLLEAPVCLKCGNTMRLRLNSRDSSVFWSCSKYPECDYKKNF